MSYTIGKLARLAGISARTLRYYDEIGLLKPSRVMPNGYRCYERPDLLRLQQILFFRELGFPLERIGQVLDAPGFDTRRALEDQKRMLDLERERIGRLLRTIDDTIEYLGGEETMRPEDLYGSFNKGQIEEYRQEVIDRWGEESLRESEERISSWTLGEARWIEQEAKAVIEGMLASMRGGAPVDDARVQELAGRYFDYMRRFFDCTPEIFRELGRMYVDDPRFAAYYARYDPQLAAYLRDAMAAWCDSRQAGAERE